MTAPLVTGLHHITAIATDPQANINFYAGLLGLRLVKKTVNFDDPAAYHLYYGDETGRPGTIITFFYWPGAPRGRNGSGQASAISFSAAPDALGFWRDRLARRGVAVTVNERFGEQVLSFADPDGIPVEIVAVAEDARPGWATAGVPVAHALRGMHTVPLTVREAAPTESLLTGVMGYSLVGREGNRSRFVVGSPGSGAFVDLTADAQLPRATGGAGTIHHIAFRVATDEDELEMQSRIADAGFQVSDVRDRTYFHSIYYRERGGILFEIATDVPGFVVDEPVSGLGESLRLPPQFEPHRKQIESLLPPLAPATVVA